MGRTTALEILRVLVTEIKGTDNKQEDEAKQGEESLMCQQMLSGRK